ncbi:MAG: hypothetical protein HLUCCX14_06255 [Marinobacter excellens HL-55]|uniref:Uncharacterized protein n=1 Tax=Marinobacter excellens HL-55 TaxID=1305731 RepID=A0A0P7ZJ90_9GAMM|nr:MAG: hypothetical protein HLUCCX14_06255 [Marinobacter excellens HL-55]
MKTTTRSVLIFPAWAVILVGSAAFLYTAYAGMLGS